MAASTVSLAKAQGRTSSSLVRTAALAILFATGPVWETLRMTALANTDVWWHLSTGLWMLHNRALPHTAIFSQHAALPWQDFSWTYDVALALIFNLIGLRAVVVVLALVRLAFAVISYMLARTAGARFWIAVVLSVIAQYVIPTLQPIPSSMSVLFFGIELLLLVRSRRRGSLRSLLWLPPLALIWANVDVQVVDGLALLFLFVVAMAVEDAYRRTSLTVLKVRYYSLPLKSIEAIAGFSFLCTLLNPCTFRIFPEFAKALYSSVGFEYFAEMHAMSFRQPQEYLLMLLVMTAFLALGRRHSLEVFEFLILIGGTLLGFRIQRDAWIVVWAALMVIAEGASSEGSQENSEIPINGNPALAVGFAGVMVAATIFRLASNAVLFTKVTQLYPKRACDFIVSDYLPTPLFNTYPWGAFITWYMPEHAVFVDSRVDLYGDELLGRYFQLISGRTRLQDDPDFASVNTLLLERQSGIAKAMTNLPVLNSQYRLVYSDDLAAVFVKK